MMLGPPSVQLSLQRRAATVRWDGGAAGERLIHFEMTRHEKVNPGNAPSRPSSSSSRIDATGCSLRDRCLFLCPPRSIEHFFVSCRRPSVPLSAFAISADKDRRRVQKSGNSVEDLTKEVSSIALLLFSLILWN